MLTWMGLTFQNGMSNTMVLIDWLHDYTIFFLIMILFLTFMIMLMMFSNNILFMKKDEMQKLEFIWTISPCFILLMLGVPSLQALYKTDSPLINPGVTLKITGHQWYWEYDYSDFEDINFDSFMIPWDSLKMGQNRLLETDNHTVLPINSDIRFIVSSVDVLHSWTIPSIGVKVDANPGRLNCMYSFSTKPFLSYGQCSEICGANHSFMPIVMEMVTPSIFSSWIKSFF